MNALKKTAAFLAVLLILASEAASSATPPAGTAAGAIRAAGDAWNKAYNALDTDALLALYSADAVLMPETARTAKGHAEIRNFLLKYMALLGDRGYTPVVANAVEIEVSGNLGIRSGTYSVTDKSGATQDTGKWLEVWRKAQGQWHITRNIWNSDMLPLFPPAAFVVAGGTAGSGTSGAERRPDASAEEAGVISRGDLSIQVHRTYGLYVVEAIALTGAPAGDYTFVVASPTAGSVELRRDGVPVQTVSYDSHATISATDPAMFYTFDFHGYFTITLRKDGSGTVNLYAMDQSIFDGLHFLALKPRADGSQSPTGLQ